MKGKFNFRAMLNWVKSTEMFARPSKLIPGKWQLVEYYVEMENELRNINENQLKLASEFWNIEFTPEKNYLQQNNIPVSLVSGIKNGNWKISKNYITLIPSEETVKSVEFQFAIEKENLRILKKEVSGQIGFFGFFRKTK